METASSLIASMAAQCRSAIRNSNAVEVSGLPKALRPKHLLWMCKKIEQHAQDWSATRLHRWIGFVQCGMMANGMLDIGGAKAMFEHAKQTHGLCAQDQDLIDHMDAQGSSEFEIGGEG